jgi:vacuolar-type H+-ATPase subunit I/STV1
LELRPSAQGPKVPIIAPRAFKRSLFGYRRQDVDDAMAWRDSALEEETARANDQMARADLLTARINDEARRADEAVLRAEELERASLDLAGRVNALEQVADRLALRVVEREREITTLTARLDATLEEIRERVEEERLGPHADVVEDEALVTGADVFDGLIEVEVGPLSDFDQLASFEDAANGIVEAEEISVKRFTKGRATLEMHLSEPVELLTELEERAPFEFTVRDTREDRVVLDVDGE